MNTSSLLEEANRGCSLKSWLRVKQPAVQSLVHHKMQLALIGQFWLCLFSLKILGLTFGVCSEMDSLPKFCWSWDLYSGTRRRLVSHPSGCAHLGIANLADSKLLRKCFLLCKLLRWTAALENYKHFSFFLFFFFWGCFYLVSHLVLQNFSLRM